MMDPTNPPPSPEKKKPINWPIAVNLGILLLIVALSGGALDILNLAVPALLVINSVAAIIMKISGRINWFFAFILSALLLLLIGAGICGLMLGNLGNMH
ncbi:MAG: hypothetical protein H7Z21_06700 [Hymenobacter sp.]|nr:hypothetical protein [Hymenobacter sp.]